MRCQAPAEHAMFGASGARQEALPHARCPPGSSAPIGNQITLKHRLYTTEAIAGKKTL